MPPDRRVPLVSLICALLLFWFPPLLLLIIGWPRNTPEETAAAAAQVVTLIAGPSPATGLSSGILRWIPVSGALILGLALGAWLVSLVFKKELGTGPAAATKPRIVLLISLGLGSLAAYGLNFLLPFPLHRYFNLKQISMGMIAERHGGALLATALAIVALFLLYALAYRLCLHQRAGRLWVVVLVGALLLALVNFYVATTTTLDPYDYIARGRITGLYGGNPYTLAPSDFPDDPFMEYVSWRESTSAYGPLWEILSAFLSRLAGDQLWANIIACKVLALLGYLTSTLLIAAILRRVAPERALSGTLLFAWNPLILMEGPANGHNDLLMVALLLAAFWVVSHTVEPAEGSAANSRWSLAHGWAALVLLAGAILVKFVPILLLPFFLLYLLGERPRWRDWIGRGLLLLSPVILLAVEQYSIFWAWPAIANTVVRRADMFRMSVGSIAKEALQQLIPVEQAQFLVSWPLILLFLLGYMGLLGRAVWTLGQPARRRMAYGLGLLGGGLAGFLGAALWSYVNAGWWSLQVGDLAYAGRGLLWPFLMGTAGAIVVGAIGAGAVFFGRSWADLRPRPWDSLVGFCLAAFLLYILLANFWFWPWYLVWPVALLALSDDSSLVAPMMLASCAGQLSHLGWNFLWYWWGISWDTVYQMDALAVLGMAVPALLTYAIITLRRRFGAGKGQTSTV